MGVVLNQSAMRISESATLATNSLISQMKLDGFPVISFAGGEPDFETPTNIKNAAKAALDRNITYCTPSAGFLELRQAICDWHTGNFGTRFTPDQCIVTPGAKQALFLLLATLIQPGDEVILPTPYWTTFKEATEYFGATVELVETKEGDQFRLKAQDVLATITDRTKVIIINSPCNPSGSIVDRAELDQIVLAARRQGIVIITDESYSHILYEGVPYSAASITDGGDTVVVVGSLSKTFAMTGWRVGFTLGCQPVIDALVRLQSHSTSHANSIAQIAAIAALTGAQDAVEGMVASYKERRDLTVGLLRGMKGIKCPMPQGAFYAYPDVSSTFNRKGIRTVADFTKRLLDETYVGVLAGTPFGSRDHVRLSFASPLSDIEAGLQRFERFVLGVLD